MKSEIKIICSDIKILLVDNQTVEIKYLKELLEGHKYKVSIAQDPLEALKIIPQYNPQIIISDVKMPKMDGYHFCAQVKCDPDTKNIPVILLTQVSSPSDILRGLNCGADNFIVKPYNNKTLLTRLHDIIMSREFRKENKNSEALDIFFLGNNYQITSDKNQVLDLLFSVLENAIHKNEELEYVNNRLMVALDNIRNLDQLKNNFISSVSHEIRTPLTAINGALKLILGGISGPLAEKTKNLMNIAFRNTERLMLLLNDILDIQKIEAGKISFKFQHVHLFPLIRQSIEINSSLAEKYKVPVEFKENVADCIVNVDPERLIQVINNLLSNAIKFSPENEPVEIRVKVKKIVVRLYVIDKGPGIPPEFRPTIYDRFTRTAMTTNQQKEGTGLGLNIAKNIIKQLNGQIDFMSTPGKGTTFYIELPRIIE